MHPRQNQIAKNDPRGRSKHDVVNYSASSAVKQTESCGVARVSFSPRRREEHAIRPKPRSVRRVGRALTGKYRCGECIEVTIKRPLKVSLWNLCLLALSRGVTSLSSTGVSTTAFYARRSLLLPTKTELDTWTTAYTSRIALSRICFVTL